MRVYIEMMMMMIAKSIKKKKHIERRERRKQQQQQRRRRLFLLPPRSMAIRDNRLVFHPKESNASILVFRLLDLLVGS